LLEILESANFDNQLMFTSPWLPYYHSITH